MVEADGMNVMLHADSRTEWFARRRHDGSSTAEWAF